MKKFLFPLFVSAIIFSNAKAQTTFSFETSEGFTVGDVLGQNAYIDTFVADLNGVSTSQSGTAEVSTEEFSDGNNSVKIIDYSDNVFSGFYISGIPFYSNTSVSYDIFVPALGGSDNFMDLYDNNGDYVGSVDFTYEGNVDFYDSTGNATTLTGYTATQWNHLEFQIDFSTSTIKVLLNNVNIGTFSYTGTGTELSEIDFDIDNYGTDVYFDHIVVKDATLATDEVSAGKNSLKVFPNPMVDFVKVNTDGKVQSAQLFDASGKLVKTFRNASEAMNVADLKKGLYIMKVKTDKGTSSAKVIKK